MYPVVSQGGDNIVNVFCITEKTAKEIHIIALEDKVPNAIFLAVRPPNNKDDPKLDNTHFMSEIHKRIVYPSLNKWREKRIEDECAEYDKQFDAGYINEHQRDELKIECYATHAYLLFTADGDYAQVNMLNMEVMKKIVRDFNIINMKWSAGCSLFQNALDKAKSYMLLNYVIRNIKAKGFHPHETPPRWWDRLKAFTKSKFSPNSAKTVNMFFSHADSIIESIFRRAIIQEGFKFTGMGKFFDLDTILGQYHDYKEWSDDKRNHIHKLFWKEVIPVASKDRCLSPMFLHGVFKNILELEDFDIMNNKEKRPLNGQYACDLNPEVINLIKERKESSMALIQEERARLKAELDKDIAAKKATEKTRIDLLKAPTINQRDEEIKILKQQCSNEKKAITNDNKVILEALKASLTNAKTEAQKDKLTKAIQKNKDNTANVKKEIDVKYSTMITTVRTTAKQTIEHILKRSGVVVEEGEDLDGGAEDGGEEELALDDVGEV